ncbi:MAG: ChbG/HpnK family deacetylase [bacterium]|nr:ChbG/HpnK family deacetylase [bacterium]
MNKPNFIINADDFGQNDEINEAVIKCFNDGFLTSASVLANGSAFDKAMEFAKNHKNFSIGIHLNLTGGKPATKNLREVSSLVKNDNFLSSEEFRKKYFRFGVSGRQIYKELENQILKFLGYGLKPSHIDSHHHIHTLPTVAMITAKLAKKYGISKIRPSSNYFTAQKINYRNFFPTSLKLAYKKMINNYFRRRFIMPDYFCEGSLDRIFNDEKFLGNLSDATYLFMSHPDISGAGISDLKILTDKNLFRLLNSDLGVKFISFNEL